MLINRKFEYKVLNRITQESGIRHYHCPETNTLVPSVTTILDATTDKKGILEWKEFVGEKKANQVKKEATDLGSLVHEHIEKHIMGIERPGGNNIIRVQAKKMADQIIENGVRYADEVWGQEVGLYYPGLYAGTTDLVGVYKGKEAIMDHKTAKKIRSKDQIEAYYFQIAAYAMAHNFLYGTNIRTGVIFMVDRNFSYQDFYIDEYEMAKNQDLFLEKVEQYSNNLES
jgi:genome maintenance exonuclease 1